MATKKLVKNSVALTYYYDDNGTAKFVSKSYNLIDSATIEQVEAVVNALSPLCEYEFDVAHVNEKHLVVM